MARSLMRLLIRIGGAQHQAPVAAARYLLKSNTSSLRIFSASSRLFSSGNRSSYDLFKGKIPSAKEFRREWAKQLEDEDDHLWTGSDNDDELEGDRKLKKEIKKAKQRALHDDVDADDSDELHGLFSESDEDKSLWTGSEGDSEDDIPTEATPHERSDKYIDTLFEFEEKPRFRTLTQALKDEEEPEEMSPGKQARKLAVQNAMKKLKKGPDGRYINVWEVMSDLDVLIGAFENIISGPEYQELREGGPRKLNMDFFKDIQNKMRDPNYQFSPEIKLKPRSSKLVSRKKWQKAESRRRKARNR